MSLYLRNVNVLLFFKKIERGIGCGVTKKPFEGDSYVGFMVRGNNSNESISQKLVTPIQAGNCYGFKIAICKSEIYSSVVGRPHVHPNYGNKIILKLFPFQHQLRRLQPHHFIKQLSQIPILIRIN